MLFLMNISNLSFRTIAVFSLIGFLFFAWAGAVGFLGSDDVAYAAAAQGWLNDFPFLGENHWSLRHTITLPLAVLFGLFGEGELTLAIPTLLYSLGLVLILIRLAQKAAGSHGVLICAALLVTNPLLVVWSTIGSIDNIEAFYVFASFAAYLKAWRNNDKMVQNWWLITSGALAALAVLTRETSIFLLVTYGALFLIGRDMPRRRYFVMAAGFILIWGLEAIYLTVMSGDPLHRFSIAAGHDNTIDRSIDLAGNVILHPALDPFLVLLFNQEFMLLFWLVCGLSVWRCWDKRNRVKEDRATDGTGIFHYVLLGAVWFLGVALLYSLLPLNPRYFLVVALAATVGVSIFLTQMIDRSAAARHTVWLLVALLVSANLVGIWSENRNFMFAERVLAAKVSENRSMIYTDRETWRRAQKLIEWSDGPELLFDPEAYKVGELYLLNRLRETDADKNWVALEEIKPEHSPLRRFILALGLYDVMPVKVRRKLDGGHPGVTLYRIEEKESD